MAILDTEYVKAPSLRAGDLSIAKSSTGFRMFEGDTVFLTGDASGTLTIGKENLTSSIPMLHINAAEVYWNNKPLEDYWGGESGGVVPDLTQDVTELQELTAENTQAIQNTDKRLSQELSELRLDALGAKINTLTSPINNSVPNICGIAVPVTLLKEALPYFNKITLNNVQNSGTGYLAIYACDVETPSVSSPCTLLYVAEETFKVTGSINAPSSNTINIPEKINVPDSGLILLIFSRSSTAPQPDNISWITEANSTMSISMGMYSPGATNRPYDTNGVYVLQKVTNPAFLTYSPDVDFSYTYDTAEDIRSIEAQIEDLRSNLGAYMTYNETIEAISTFPHDGLDNRLYNLGSLVDALTIPTTPLTLVKGTDSSIKFNHESLSLTSAALNDEDTGTYIAAAEFKLASGITQLALNKHSTDYSNLVDVAALTMRNVSLEDSEAGAIELKNIYQNAVDRTSAQVHLTTSPGRLELGIRDNYKDVFQLLAQAPVNDSNTTGVCILYKSLNDSDRYGRLDITQGIAAISAHNDPAYGLVRVSPAQIELSMSSDNGRSYGLNIMPEGLLFTAPNSIWIEGIGLSSQFIPTISIVHYLIQQAIANQ